MGRGEREERRIETGAKVVVVGLQEHPHLNNKHASVVGWRDKRPVIRFDAESGVKPRKMAMREVNLRLASDAGVRRGRRRSLSRSRSRSLSRGSPDIRRGRPLPSPSPSRSRSSRGGRGKDGGGAKPAGSDADTSSSGPLAEPIRRASDDEGGSRSTESLPSELDHGMQLGLLTHWTECPGSAAADFRRYATVQGDDGESYTAYYPRDFLVRLKSQREGRRVAFKAQAAARRTATGRAADVRPAPRGAKSPPRYTGNRRGIRIRMNSGEYVEVPPSHVERLSATACARLQSMGFVGWCRRDFARAGECPLSSADCEFVHIVPDKWPRRRRQRRRSSTSSSPSRSGRRRRRSPPRITSHAFTSPTGFRPPPGWRPPHEMVIPIPATFPLPPRPPRSRSRERRRRDGGSGRRRRSGSSGRRRGGSF
eukprot:Hpha_TRINITY_DN10054_c0_g3::TRINITY_DN10054_c0_g3_i1::g.83910::m.83910